MPSVLIALCAYVQSKKGATTGISFIDSTSIKVCHNIRIKRNKVFAGLAKRGKSSMGWFFGFKLHLVVNDQGEILSFFITAGNVSDRDPVKHLTKNLMGKLFGDKGYLSKKLFEDLFQRGLQLITNIRKNMKNKFVPLMDKMLLRKRFIIETINDQLKNISQIEHSRHRSVTNFMVNLLAGLAAYIHQPKKPSIKLYDNQLDRLAIAC
jgi:transposase